MILNARQAGGSQRRERKGMYQHLLIATDGSELARKAVDHGLELARALGARVLLVYVTPPWAALTVSDGAAVYPPENYDRIAADQAQNILANAAMAAKAAGVVCETLHVKDGLPATGIIGAAQEHGADLIVMSSHGRSGLRRVLLGSEANEVVTKSTIPVLICR
jgi:nucleotide-binding universal stress UspA family protein